MSEDLNSLANEASVIDNKDNQLVQTDQTGQQEQSQPSPNQGYKSKIVEFFTFGVISAAGMMPKIPLRDHFTDAHIDGIADAAIKVADKEGWDLNQLFGDPNSRWGAWLSLLMAMGFPCFTLWMAINSQKTEKEVQAVMIEPETAAQPTDLSKGFHA